MPRYTKTMEITSLQNRLAIKQEEFRKLELELRQIQNKDEDRKTQQVEQILQSMSNMMEAACRVVLSIHKNL